VATGDSEVAENQFLSRPDANFSVTEYDVELIIDHAPIDDLSFFSSRRNLPSVSQSFHFLTLSQVLMKGVAFIVCDGDQESGVVHDLFVV
jgi:hypothetical protein